MSRVGKVPIDIPGGVTVSVAADKISVSGLKGSLEQFSMPGIKVSVEGSQVLVSRANDDSSTRAKHGLMRALVQNMIQGVNEGFERKLELNGVGFRVQPQGSELKLNLGFSHEVVYKIPAGVTVGVEQNIISVSGTSKQQVGQVAAEIRSLKKPEPYKGKGLKYLEEQIIRKSGKSGKETAGA